MVQFTCDYCGNTFLQYPSNRVDPPYFCNRGCYHAWRRARMESVCQMCNKPFTAANVRLRRFCSRKCGGIWASANRLKERAPVWKGGPPKYKCETCHKEYQQIAYTTHNRNQQHFFCSHACHGVWISQHRNGANNPNWKPGAKKHQYYGPNWKMQKQAARKRDNYQCQVCQKTTLQNGREMDVHHIRPFLDFGYDPDHNDAYIQANDLINLITLCRSCHKRAEHGKITLPSLVPKDQVLA